MTAEAVALAEDAVGQHAGIGQLRLGRRRRLWRGGLRFPGHGLGDVALADVLSGLQRALGLFARRRRIDGGDVSALRVERCDLLVGVTGPVLVILVAGSIGAFVHLCPRGLMRRQQQQGESQGTQHESRTPGVRRAGCSAGEV